LLLITLLNIRASLQNKWKGVGKQLKCRFYWQVAFTRGLSFVVFFIETYAATRNVKSL